MIPIDILSRVRAAGIRLETLPDGRIKASPKNLITEDMKRLIVEHRAEILAVLTQPAKPSAELMTALRSFGSKHKFTQADFVDAVEMLRVAEHPDAWLEFLNRDDGPSH